MTAGKLLYLLVGGVTNWVIKRVDKQPDGLDRSAAGENSDNLMLGEDEGMKFPGVLSHPLPRD
ncbi:MAG: hypothetical protein M3Z28_11730 [Candidatus Dormibacteraeota bacterium]|nr:hypothetical protein [Candidatus Dormibacteraeota bacterium]